MAFQFSLDAVLRLRTMVEEREERLLQQIAQELAKVSEQLETAHRRIVESYAAIGQESGNLAFGHELHAAYGEVTQSKELAKDLEARIAKLEPLRDKQRLVYQAARRDREVLTDMYRDQRRAYEHQRAREEQKALDDNYIARRVFLKSSGSSK